MHFFTIQARLAFAGLACAVLAVITLGSSSAAANPSDERLVPSGSVALPRDADDQRRSSGASTGSPGRSPSGSSRCATLRKAYAQSQVCFAHYRLKNGGLRPGAFRHCKQIKNPSVQCGSAVVG